MAARVYTQRFAHIGGAGGSRVFTVQPGHRAVVTNVSYAAYQSPGSQVWVGVANIWAFLVLVPGADAAGAQACKLVAYAGENVTLLTNGSNIAAHVAGYYFLDPDGPPLGGTVLPSSELELPPGLQLPPGP